MIGRVRRDRREQQRGDLDVALDERLGHALRAAREAVRVARVAEVVGGGLERLAEEQLVVRLLGAVVDLVLLFVC